MTKSLTQNINFPIVFRVVGWLLMIEAAFMIMPAAVAFYYNDINTALSFVYALGITFVFGALMTFGLKPRTSAMRRREGLLLTAIVWFVFSLFGMLPFLFSGAIDNVTDAYFETMSGFTTTGATVIRQIEDMPQAILFWRALMQWIGGMGIILFTLAILPMLNYKGGIALFNAEVTGITHERMRPRVSQTAKYLWGMYLSMTVIMTLMLFAPMGWFDAVCHTMATVSTGGFSTKTAGICYWNNNYVYLVVTFFMFLCGINFTLLFKAAKGKLKEVAKNDILRWYVGVIIISAIIIVLYMGYMGFCDDWIQRGVIALFDTVAAATSTRFTTFDYEVTGNFIAFLLMILMFFGGMAGSTSGGAKIDRMIVLFKNTKNEFYRVLHPNAVTSVRLGGRVIPYEVVSKVIAFLSIYVVILIIVALFLTLMGISLFDSLFASLSALSNTGFSYGATIESGFGILPDPAKWLLAFEMAVGRLELFTVLILFSRNFWIKD